MKPQDRKAGSCVKEMKQRLGLWVLVDEQERPILDAPSLGSAPGGVRKMGERIREENDCGATIGDITGDAPLETLFLAGTDERRQVVS